MPNEGIDLTPQDEVLSADEIVKIASLFASQGVDKIRLTGGEPTVNPDLVQIVERISALDGIKTVGLTTNALVLSKMLPQLLEAGLTHINISLDTLLDFKYEMVTRRRGFKRVLKGIDDALEAGLSPVKINTVVMRNFNEDELGDFVELTRDKDIDVRFIEFMPFGGNKWTEGRVFPYSDMVATIQERFPDFASLDSGPHETAKAWKVPGFVGQVGFITSMSDHFCGGCNRLRMTADGNLKVCLFGNTEVSLRDALRSGMSDDELLGIIGQAVGRKKKQHAGMKNLSGMKNRPMILIGG